MLITKKLLVKWNPANKKHYENKGYIFNSIWQEAFEIDVNDLPKSSNEIVEAKCDFCGEGYKIDYNHYNQNRKNNSKDSCGSKECKLRKRKDTVYEKYGADNVFKIYKRKKIKLVNPKTPRKLSFSIIKNFIDDNNCVLLTDEKDYIKTKQTLKIRCKCGNVFYASYSQFKYRNQRSCCECSLINRSGSNHSNWSGGVTEINRHLRNRMFQWKLDSLKEYNYKCAISGASGNLEVHHVNKNFNEIIQEMFILTNIKLKKNVCDYSNEELTQLENKCLELHYKYGLGIPLTKQLHEKFHSKYGRKDNNLEQFLLFKKENIVGK